MVRVDLGTQILVTGNPPVSFTEFPYNISSAYLIFYQFTITNPGDLFSSVNLKVRIENPQLPNFFAPDTISLVIREGVFSFYFPASSLFQIDGNARIYAERISLRGGSADPNAQVSLNLLYNDEATTPTWR